MRFQNISIAKLNSARKYAAEKDYACARAALSGTLGLMPHVDVKTYVIRKIKNAKEIEAGKHDNNFTIWQRMTYFLTGECVGFLAKT